MFSVVYRDKIVCHVWHIFHTRTPLARSFMSASKDLSLAFKLLPFTLQYLAERNFLI